MLVTQKQDFTLYPWGEEILVQKVMLEKVERGEGPAYQRRTEQRQSETDFHSVFLIVA